MAIVDEDDVFTDTHHRVHVMCVDDSSDIVFLCDAGQKFVYDKGSFRIETGVGFVAEEIFGVEDYGACDSDTFCIPPEISLGYLLAASSSPTRSRHSSVRRSRSRLFLLENISRGN